ncbi:hypothetical protein [Methyloversatilis thermotolerans]|uniref:hypothetical protein n=1 Tax=Methyloversatilis thermotolerans TaxID=1346290 RepID=UPI00036B0100|nr:hypothetical protein [Methyloversatilis thermotolerans]
MAISWIGAVKAVPWGDVIAAAPGVVQGANALWERVARKRGRDEAAPAVHPGEPEGDRIAALERTVVELQKEALASSQLIRTLAEQNAQLIAKADALQLRVRVLTLAGAGLLVAVVATLASVLGR